jgi:Putative adhesin
VAGDNGSGNITLTFTKVPKRVDVTDESGDITLVLPPGPTAYQVVTQSTSGSTSVSVNRSQSSPYVITASDGFGNITIR